MNWRFFSLLYFIALLYFFCGFCLQLFLLYVSEFCQNILSVLELHSYSQSLYRTWLVDSRGIARKVRNATQSIASQIKDCGANRECPNCHHRIDNSDVS